MVNFVSAVVHVFYLLYKELSNKSVGLRFSKPELFHCVCVIISLTSSVDV